MANYDMQEALSPAPYHLMQIRPLEGHGTQNLGSPMPTDIGDEEVQKRCVPIPRWTGARLMAVGAWQMDFLMAMGMQRTWIRSMAVVTWRSGDNLGTKARYSYQWQTTKM